VESASTRQRGPSFDAAGSGAISEALRSAVRRGDAAAVVGLVVSEREEIYREAFGELSAASHTPLAADSIFRIYSMTKPVTSVAVMMLVEEKRIALDDPLDKHLEAEGARPAVVSVDASGHFVTRPPNTPITIRHLLTNTSGIAYAFTSELVQKVQENAPRIADTSILVHDPGERWTYGPGTKLLGDVVATVSGKGLDTFMQERIFAPLAMNDTGFTVPGGKMARLVTVHQRRDGKLVEQPTPATIKPDVRGDYGLYSTASDYGRFVRMLLNRGELDGRRLLAAATVQQMSSHQIGPLTVVEQPALDPSLSSAFPRHGGRDGFGLGFQIARPPKPEPGRRAAGSLSWSGVMNTFFWVDPASRMGAVLLMQVLPFADAPSLRVLDAFEEGVYRHLR
jgi:CubicO group peptidase (beta-lactamase class C family)